MILKFSKKIFYQILTPFPMKFLKNFNGFKKLFEITFEHCRSKFLISAQKGVILGVKVEKKMFRRKIVCGLVKGIPPGGQTNDFFRFFFAKDSQFKTLFLQGSPVKKFQQQRQRKQKSCAEIESNKAKLTPSRLIKFHIKQAIASYVAIYIDEIHREVGTYI